jgi:spore coat protein CotH
VATGQPQTADDLFNDSVVHDIRLEVHPRDWATLKLNFEENTYYPCNLYWRGIAADGAGMRSRGLGSRSGTKPGLRIDFNRYEERSEFVGLKSVVLDNVVQDQSLSRERISMKLFRLLGVPTPREAHARLFVNGEYVGLYVIVEAIDKRFLKLNLGEDEGFLYEFNWVGEYRFEYFGEEAGYYSPVLFDPQTHENDPQPQPLVDFIRTVNEAPDEGFGSEAGAYVDLSQVAVYLAVENFLSEIDGLAGYAGMNNFYLYRYAGRNLFQFLPWDKDVTMTDLLHPIDYNLDTNVLTRRMMNVPELRAAYYSALRQAADVAGGSGGWLEQEIEQTYSQIRTDALNDPYRTCEAGQGAACNFDFEQHFEGLREFARTRAAYVIQALDERGL